jgi:hypothetical protein
VFLLTLKANVQSNENNDKGRSIMCSASFAARDSKRPLRYWHYGYLEMDILNDLPELPLISDDRKRYIRNWVVSAFVILLLLCGVVTFFGMIWIIFFEGCEWIF